MALTAVRSVAVQNGPRQAHRSAQRASRIATCASRAAPHTLNSGVAGLVGAGAAAPPTQGNSLPPHAAAAVASELAVHPSGIRPGNLVPTLQAALNSLAGLPASLASPLLLGLLSYATQLLGQPGADGPQAPLLVLELLSHADAGCASARDSRQVAHARALWRRAHIALGDAADVAGRFALLCPDLMSPDAVIRYYEAAARASTLGGRPSKSCGLGLLLRSHLHGGRFSTDELVRLLTSWAQLRARMHFNPDGYNYAELAAQLALRVDQLSGAQLEAVAAAAPLFEWPVYRSMPLLHAVCREAVHRALAGALPLPVAQRVLSLAIRGAAAMRPCLATELEEASAEWMQSAAAARRAAAALQPAAAAAQQPMYGAAFAAAAECSNNIVQVGAGTASLLAASP